MVRQFSPVEKARYLLQVSRSCEQVTWRSLWGFQKSISLLHLNLEWEGFSWHLATISFSSWWSSVKVLYFFQRFFSPDSGAGYCGKRRVGWGWRGRWQTGADAAGRSASLLIWFVHTFSFFIFLCLYLHLCWSTPSPSLVCLFHALWLCTGL